MSAREWLASRLAATRRDPRRITEKLDAFKAEVLREAAEKIRAHATEWQENYKHHWFEGQQDAADLIDPDKENSADGTEADRA